MIELHRNRGDNRNPSTEPTYVEANLHCSCLVQELKRTTIPSVGPLGRMTQDNSQAVGLPFSGERVNVACVSIEKRLRQ
jgi:hypothetical protein